MNEDSMSTSQSPRPPGRIGELVLYFLRLGLLGFGGPVALVTNRCVFGFDRERQRFRLDSVHPGHSVAEVAEHTGFAYDCLENVQTTPAPAGDTLRLLRGVVAPQLAEVYPQFAASVFGVAAQ